MRIGLLSDTHIVRNRPALPRKLIDGLVTCDLILHAGDICDESGLAAVKAIGPEVAAVTGNMDRGSLIDTLPEFHVAETPAGAILVLHVLPSIPGGPQALVDRLLGDHDRPLAIVHGHTHRPDVQEVAMGDGRQAWVINPGSATHARGYGRTFAVMQLADGQVRVDIETLD
ncbi:MAG: metallophosphoesterase family protein [Planctomycetes bacterium]|nr:metallophosphoesterase family protein [Planctomycetota bacterium]